MKDYTREQLERIHDRFRDTHKALYYYFKDAKTIYKDDDDNLYIEVNGKEYTSEITLNPLVPDDMCCRVKIGRSYYYFG